MTAQTATAHYSERLVPGLGIFIAWLLVLPAVTLVMMPINKDAAIPTAIGAYVLAVVLFLAMSPKIEVRDGVLTAGRAHIPVELLGEIEPLGSDALKAAIGPGSDARNFMLVRGWIHKGLKIEVTDESDPTPYWVITSRKPLALADAISEARKS